MLKKEPENDPPRGPHSFLLLSIDLLYGLSQAAKLAKKPKLTTKPHV